MGTTQPIRNKKTLENFRNYYKKEENKPRNYALIDFWAELGITHQRHFKFKMERCMYSAGYLEHIIVTEKKTGKKNVLALNRAMKEALDYYRKTIETIDSEHYVFSSQKVKDEPITRSQAFRIIQKAAQKCGMKEPVSCHSLRKTFGYYAWKNGTPPALLMSIYNHSSYEITKRYLGIEQLDKDEVYEKNVLQKKIKKLKKGG